MRIAAIKHSTIHEEKNARGEMNITETIIHTTVTQNDFKESDP
jgi:hypothetical protein